MSVNEYLDPYDPMNDFVPSDEPGRDAVAGCLISMGASIIILLMLCAVLVLTGCTSQKIISDNVTEHSTQELLHRMDSLLSSRTVVQQDSAWRETILMQFQSIREKSDTSHFVVTDTAGNVIREKIIINNVRETNSATDRHEREVLLHRLEVIDSTMNVMREQIQHSDSLLLQRQEKVVKEVRQPLSWWQQVQIWLGRLVLVALLVAAGVWIYRKRAWWLSLLKRLF